MRKIFTIFSILSFIFLVAVPASACAVTQEAYVLVLNVTTPQNGVTVASSPLAVNGNVSGSESSSAQVTVDGAGVRVTDGKFSTTVMLTSGNNVITVMASTADYTQSKTLNVTYTPAS